MLVQAGLFIDFGNSSTRVGLLVGDKKYRFNLSNRFATLPMGYKINAKYADGKSTVFKLGEEYFANGQIVDMEFASTCKRPTAMSPKPSQLTTELTINLAIFKAYQIISKVYAQPIDKLDVSFKISALLPPIDHEMHEQALIDLFVNTKQLNIVMPVGVTLNVKIEPEVSVFSEAVAAFFAAFYTEEGGLVYDNSALDIDNGDVLVYDNGQNIQLVEVPENKQFMEGYVLGIDIGAGTTDIVLFLDMELIESSKDTFKQGGNTVKSIVSNSIRKAYGFTPNDATLENAIRSGVLVAGTVSHDISAIITQAKQNYSNTMLGHINQYLERMEVPLQLVKGLLVSGGGSLASVNEGQVTSPPMSDILIDFLKTISQGITNVSTGNKNLRELNIDGLGILHKHA